MTRPRMVLLALAGVAFLAGAAAQVAIEGRPRYRAMPEELARGHTRLELAGADLSAAGVARAALDAERLRYRQTCRGACDQILVDFETIGEEVYRLSAEDASGAELFSGGTYVDGHMWDALAAGEDGRLAQKRVKLGGYYGL